MRRITTIFALCAIIAGICPDAVAQTSPTQTPAAYSLPWNDLLPLREWHSQYTSIVSQPGSQFIPGSNGASPYGPAFTLPLPFDMEFLGSFYPAGTPVYAGIGGYLAFASPTGTAPYVLMPSSSYTGMIMPYWSDLHTTGLPGEGIYTRYDVDPGSGDSTWTIEWVVQTMSAPAASGRFQLQIIKRGVWAGLPIAEYIFNYDRKARLPRGVPPGYYGAQIGIKNLGQPVGPPPALGPGSDDGMFLLLTPPSAHPTTPAITRLPTRYAPSQNFTPDWYATATSPVSSFFHYDIPDSSLRVKPIDADIGCVRKGDDSGQFTYAPISEPGVSITGTVLVANHGAIPQGAVPLVVHLFKGGKEVDSFATKITYLPARDTMPVEFSIPGKESGAYTAVAVVSARIDQNRANDTAVWRIFVRPRMDVAPVAISIPVLDGSEVYSDIAGVPVIVRIGNLGTGTPKQVITSVVIRDTGSAVVHEIHDTTAQIPGPGETRELALGVVMLPTGRYSIDSWTSIDGDEIAGNDSLASIPRLDWTGHGTTPEARRPARRTFEVFRSQDLGAGDPGFFPHLPLERDTVRDSVMVLATFTSAGEVGPSTWSGRVMIRDSENTVVYNNVVGLPALPPGRAYHWSPFPSFKPSHSGRYCVEAIVDPAGGDSNPANDTVRWCFVAQVADTADTTSAVAVAGLNHSSIDVAPNPTSGLVTVRWTGAAPGRLRLTVTDVTGVDLVEALHQSNGGSDAATLDASRLASGYYLIRIEEADGRRRIVPLVIQR